MKINGLLRLQKGVNGFRGDRPTERQWQPTNTAHDPNPPITLESGGGGSPVNYALTCAVGSYAIAGQAATLTVGRRLALSAGAYAYAGNDANLVVGRNLPLDAGSYSYVGNDAALQVGKALALESGAYAYTGNDIGLVVGRNLPLDSGSYDYVGNDATLTYTPGIPPRPSMGWIPLREADEDKPDYKPRHTLEKEDKESRIKFIRDLMEGRATAPVLEKSVRKVRAKVKNVEKVEQLYIAEELLLQVQEDATKRVEEAYQKWLHRYDDDIVVLLLGAFP